MQTTHELDARVPDIGTLSREKRLTAFLVIADYLQNMIVDDKVDFDEAFLSLILLQSHNKKFSKAFDQFKFFAMQGRFSVGTLDRFAYWVAKQINPNMM